MIDARYWMLVGKVASPMKKLPLDTLLSILRDLRRDLRQPINIRFKMKLTKMKNNHHLLVKLNATSKLV